MNMQYSAWQGDKDLNRTCQRVGHKDQVFKGILKDTVNSRSAWAV